MQWTDGARWGKPFNTINFRIGSSHFKCRSKEDVPVVELVTFPLKY